MILQDVWHVALGFSTGMPIEVEPVQEHLSTDTGLLLFRQFDDELKLTQDLALNWSTLEPTRRIRFWRWFEVACSTLSPAMRTRMIMIRYAVTPSSK